MVSLIFPCASVFPNEFCPTEKRKQEMKLSTLSTLTKKIIRKPIVRCLAVACLFYYGMETVSDYQYHAFVLSTNGEKELKSGWNFHLQPCRYNGCGVGHGENHMRYDEEGPNYTKIGPTFHLETYSFVWFQAVRVLDVNYPHPYLGQDSHVRVSPQSPITTSETAPQRNQTVQTDR